MRTQAGSYVSELGHFADVLIDSACSDAERIAASLGMLRTARIDVEARLRAGELAEIIRATIAVLGDRGRTGLPADLIARRLRSCAPYAAIYVCTPTILERQAILPLHARRGVDRVFNIGASFGLGQRALDDLVACIRSRLQCPPPESHLREIGESLPDSLAASIGAYCLRNGLAVRSVASVAEWFQIPHRTLREHLRRAGHPTCEDLPRAGRHLHFGELSRRHGSWSRERLAQVAGFGSASAVRSSRRRLSKRLDASNLVSQRLRGLIARD